MDIDDMPNLEPVVVEEQETPISRFITHGVAIPKTDEERIQAISKFTNNNLTTQFSAHQIAEQIALCFFTNIVNPAVHSASYDSRMENMRSLLYPDFSQIHAKLSPLQYQIVTRDYEFYHLDDRIAHTRTQNKKGLAFLGACPAVLYHDVHKKLIDANPQYNFALDVFPMKLGNWMIIQTEGQTQNIQEIYQRCFNYHFDCLLKHREIFERRTEIGQFILMHRAIIQIENQMLDPSTPKHVLANLQKEKDRLLELEDKQVMAMYNANKITPTMQMYRPMQASLQPNSTTQEALMNSSQKSKIDYLNELTSGDSGHQRFINHCIAYGQEHLLTTHDKFSHDLDFEIDGFTQRRKKTQQAQESHVLSEPGAIPFTPIYTAVNALNETSHAVVMFLADPLLPHQGGTHGIFNVLFCGKYDHCEKVAQQCVDAFDNLIPAYILKSGKIQPMPIEVQIESNRILHKDRVAEKKKIGF